MDLRDIFTIENFNQDIEFRPTGTTTFAGVTFNAESAALITGAPDGAIVTLNVAETAVFTIRHEMLAIPAERIIVQNGAGGFFVQNNDLLLKRTGEGIGTRMFAHQASKANALGFAGISLFAGVGVDERNGQGLNGRYSWARCGFDADLPYTYEGGQKYIRTFGIKDDIATQRRAAWLSAWPQELRHAIRVRDVMQSEAGQRWWRKCPDGGTMDFDFSDGSRWEVLDAYLVEKGIQIHRDRERAVDRDIAKHCTGIN